MHRPWHDYLPLALAFFSLIEQSLLLGFLLRKMVRLKKERRLRASSGQSGPLSHGSSGFRDMELIDCLGRPKPVGSAIRCPYATRFDAHIELSGLRYDGGTEE